MHLRRIGDFLERLKAMGARSVKVGEVTVHFAEAVPTPTAKAKRRTEADILEHSA